MNQLKRTADCDQNPELESQIQVKSDLLSSPQTKMQKIQALVDNLNNWQKYLIDLENLIQHDPELSFAATNQYAIKISHYFHRKIAAQIADINHYYPTEAERKFFQKLNTIFAAKDSLIQSDQHLFDFTSNLNKAINQVLNGER